jgi:hypothetical protein
MRTVSDFIQDWFLTTLLNGFIFTRSFSHKKKMGSEKHTAEGVVHGMIERIYFHSIIFSQKEMGSEKHTADVVVPGEPKNDYYASLGAPRQPTPRLVPIEGGRR